VTELYLPLVFGGSNNMQPMPCYVLDLSTHNFYQENHNISLQKAKDQGIVAVAIRATIGLAVDNRHKDIYNAAKEVGIAPTFYHVTVPNVSEISQMDNFFRQIDGLDYEWGLVLDNEIANGMDNQRITHVIWYCFNRMELSSDFTPINYTRQSWWDWYVNPWSGWSKYKLFAARYDSYSNPYLTSPWSDNKYKFRDYDNWLFWQAYADKPPNNQGSRYGVDSTCVDMDIFNGTKDELLKYLGIGVTPPDPPPSLTLEERVKRLEDCVSKSHPGCI